MLLAAHPAQLKKEKRVVGWFDPANSAQGILQLGGFVLPQLQLPAFSPRKISTYQYLPYLPVFSRKELFFHSAFHKQVIYLTSYISDLGACCTYENRVSCPASLSGDQGINTQCLLL